MGEDENTRHPRGRMSRRAFLEGGALTVGAAAIASASVLNLAGCASGGSGATSATTSAGQCYEVYETDMLIIGSGDAGIGAAMEAYAEGQNVIIAEKSEHGFGGATGFNWNQFVNFTRDDLSWEQSKDFVLNELTNQKIEKASYETWPGEERNLLLRYSKLGNTVYVRDEATGAIKPLLDLPTIYGMYRGFPRHMNDCVHESGMKIIDRTLITDLLVQNGVCTGAMGIYLPTGTFRVIRAKAVVDCTGASCWMYGWNTVAPFSINSPDNTGDIDAAAFRHNCALVDAEFFQCDLINIEPTGIAASFVSGIGADSSCCEYICDKNGNYFFKGMDYASLDKITFTQTIAKCISEGKGTENGGVYVDFSSPEAFKAIGECYTRNIDLWKKVFDIDVKGSKLECALEAYEHGGNPRADETLMAEDMKGYFLARGGSYSGSQGGTSVDVAPRNAALAARSAISYAKSALLPALDANVVATEYNRLHDLFSKNGGKRPQEIRMEIQNACYSACQPDREPDRMKTGIDELARIRKEEMPKMTLGDSSLVYNTDWKTAIENYNLLDIAEASAKAALYREETRGHMYRSDCPDIDNSDWKCNVVVHYNNGDIQCEKQDVVTI
jgi:succinate dehydrogenase/fumarate reductase flavoprotein subunit